MIIFCLVVHSRSQAVGMWQALVEEGAIAHGRKSCLDFLVLRFDVF
jgi:phosphopantothenate synthetase